MTYEQIACFDDVGRMMAKRAAGFDVSGRMSSALSAIRTKMGAPGGPNSVGRVAGAPSVHAPSAQGITSPKTENAPRLGFPQIPSAPRA